MVRHHPWMLLSNVHGWWISPTYVHTLFYIMTKARSKCRIATYHMLPGTQRGAYAAIVRSDARTGNNVWNENEYCLTHVIAIRNPTTRPGLPANGVRYTHTGTTLNGAVKLKSTQARWLFAAGTLQVISERCVHTTGLFYDGIMGDSCIWFHTRSVG